MHLSTDIFEKLKTCFLLERAAQIYCYALILCANGFLHIDQVDDFYQESSLYCIGSIPSKWGYGPSNLLHDIGLRGNPVHQFEQSLIDACSRNVAIDRHVIRSCSTENDLAEPGYKLKELKHSQVNVLIAYDIQNRLPLMYRTYRGSSVDKKKCGRPALKLMVYNNGEHNPPHFHATYQGFNAVFNMDGDLID